MSLHRLLLLCIAAPLFSGCLSSQPPNWVQNPQAIYPESTYLVALGEGDTRRAAENAAAANLSRSFEARIESSERLQENSHETHKAFDRTVDFATDVNILSATTLYNIQHAEAWTDPTTARVHAIAYLERNSTAAILREKIDSTTARIHFLSAQALETKDLLRRYATLRAAAQLVAQNDQLLQQLRVIHPRSVAHSTPSYTPNRIYQALADTAQNIRVDIQLPSETDRQIAATLEEWVTLYGFVIGKPAVLTLSGNVTLEPVSRKANLDFVRYSLELHMTDAKGTILVAVNEKGREGHNSPQEARQRALRTLRNSITANGSRRLDAYFNSLVNQH